MAIPWAASQAEDWLNRNSGGAAIYNPYNRRKNQLMVNEAKMLDLARRRGQRSHPQNRLGPAGGARQAAPQPVPQQSPQQPALSGFGFGGGGGMINTSITPQNIYSPRLTNMAVNQAAANASTQGNLPFLLQQASRAGIGSRSPAALAAAMPQVARASVNANTARQAIPFSDAMANAKNMLAGQVAREDEALGWGGLQNRMADLQRGYRTSNQASILQLLSSMV